MAGLAEQFETLRDLATGTDRFADALQAPLIGAAIRTQMSDLPEVLQNADYTSDIVTDISELVSSARFLEADYTQEQFEADVTEITQTAIADHLATLPANERFAALQEIQTATAGLAEGPQAEQLNGFINSIDQAGPGIQTAFMHAYTNNPGFREYLAEQAANAPAPEAGEEPTNFMGPILDSLYMRDNDGEILIHNGEPVIDPQRAGPIQDILTNVGNDPAYDMDLVDNVISATQTHADLLARHETMFEANPNDPELGELNDQIREAEVDIIRSVRAAGGNVNAFATLDGAMMMTFMSDLFDGGADQALSNLANGLGLSGEQLDAFMEQFGPLAEMLQFMFEPYAELYQEYAPAAREGIENLVDRANTLSGGNRVVSFQADAPATTGNVVNFPAQFNEATAGITTPVMTPDQVREAIIQVDPELADEMAGIQANIDLRAQFERFGSMTREDVQREVAELQEQLANPDVTVREAVAGIGTPGL